MIRILNKIPFRTLSRENQDTLRREYRSTYREHYNYSIRLFVLFSICGILILLGIILFMWDTMVASLIATIGLIGFIMSAYFLYRSNDKFVRFLNRKGYKYK